MRPIIRERFEFALSQLKPEDGFGFEQFMNSLLIREIPDLRPVGGIHDVGIDAFVYQSGRDSEVFVQHSVTTS